MVEVTKRVRVVGLIALVALVAGLGIRLVLSLAGPNAVPETGRLTGEISLQYGGPRVIEVSHGHGTVVVDEGEHTIATQSVAKGHQFRFVLAKGSYQLHAELSSVQGESYCNTVRVLVRPRSSSSVKLSCFNSAG
jgi:hypothetical protein